MGERASLEAPQTPIEKTGEEDEQDSKRSPRGPMAVALH